MRLHDNDGKLTQPENLAFKEALCDAFELTDFKIMLWERLPWPEESVPIANNFETMVVEIIRYAEKNNQTRELLAAALIERPQNKQLLDFAKRFALNPPWKQYLSPSQASPPENTSSSSSQPAEPSPEERLERKIHELDSDVDVVQWRNRLERLERQICRVEVQTSRGNIDGSGFLVGPDIVMTNYHVVKEVINGQISPSKVKLYFDYKLDKDGKMQNPGDICELAEDWLVNHSENSELDLKKHEHIVDVEAYKLDYALLRLKSSPGLASIKDEKETIRGWMELPTEDYDFKMGEALFILHHPDGDPLKLTMNTQGIKEISANKTRVWYTTNTEYGSSGAPCFNLYWQLVAIHQSGDPDYHKDAEYNQGIPLATIFNFLKKRGKGNVVSEKPPVPATASLNDLLPVVPIADVLDIEFASPESMLNEKLQKLLLSKLDKSVSNYPSNEHKLIELDENVLKNIASKLSVWEFLDLGEGYLRVAKDEVTEARKPFDGEGNLRFGHYSHAIAAIDVICACLRNLCALLNTVDSFPSIASVRLQVTVKADKLISDLKDFRQYLEKIKGKSLDISKRTYIRNEFVKLKKELGEIALAIPSKIAIFGNSL